MVDLNRTVPFYDQVNQAGIRTPPQRHCVYMTFTLTKGATRADLQVLLARWTAAIAQMVQGKTIGPVQPARPDAVGMRHRRGGRPGARPRLTVTVGLGPGVFDDRFDLAAKRRRCSRTCPAFPGTCCSRR